MTIPPKKSVTGRRAQQNYLGLGRTAIESHYRTLADNLPAGAARPPLDAFDSSDIWPWITNWVKATYQTNIESLFVPADKRHSFNAYPASGERGHYDLSGLAAADGSIRIAIAGDWGTGTDVAQQVTDSMATVNPELTIHLGDIYYVGTPEEVQENCLGVNGEYKGVTWRSGSKGSLALNGNHEMYSGGQGYFDYFLPTLGIPSTRDQKQLASYFCLEMPGWRILGIDTGYNSDVFLGDCTLDPTLLAWLSTVVDPVKNRKPTILMSHHQWFSGFDDGNYGKPADQMAPFLQNQDIVWLWGHEHRLAIYNRFKSKSNRLSCYARCMGHGGMPCAMPDPQYPLPGDQTVEYWDGNQTLFPGRFQTFPDNTVVSANGYVQMVIKGETLTLEYHDADGTSVLKEGFTPGGGANWDGTLVRTVLSDPGILQHMVYESQ